MLEQFPGVTDGLSRSERQAVAELAGGMLPFEELFDRSQRAEERRRCVRRLMPSKSEVQRLLEARDDLLALDGGRLTRCPGQSKTIGKPVLRVAPSA